MRISDWSSDVCSSDLSVDDAEDGETTIPARKLFDIVRALPDGSKVTVAQGADKVTVQAGRSRFTLDRKSVVEGKSVSVRVDLGGRRSIKQKRKNNNILLNIESHYREVKT